MDRQLLLQKFVKEELARYKCFYNKNERRLRKAPKGSLVERGEGRMSIAVRENGKRHMIALSSQDELLIEELKIKRYLSKELPVVKKKIQLLEGFLSDDIVLDTCKIRSELGHVYQDVSGLELFLPGDMDPMEWADADYKTNPYHPENIRHFTEEGVPVRSKSEAMIGTQLERHGILYRYDSATRLKRRTVYTDFKFLHPYSRRIIYWEHFGKSDDPDYMHTNLNRLDEYAETGIYMGYNLIITHESVQHPLTIKEINDTINKIFRL